jgi:hypothetical protein
MTIVIEQAEWDEKRPYVDSSVFVNLPEASEQLSHAERDLHKECKRLNKAVKRWAGSGLAPEMVTFKATTSRHCRALVEARRNL